MLEAGAKANVKGEDGETPLMAAASLGHLAIVQILVEAGAKVNATNDEGEYALLRAAHNGRIEVFSYLAPLTSTGKRRQAEVALGKGIRHRLHEDGLDSGQRQIFYDTAVNKLEWLREAISRGIDVNALAEDGYALIHRASEGGHLAVVRILIEAGADCNLRTENGKQQTSLMLASLTGRTKLIKLLLESGVDISCKDSNSETSLLIAIKHSAPADTVELLVEAGSDLTAKDQNNKIALAIAKDIKRDDLFSLLQVRLPTL